MKARCVAAVIVAPFLLAGCASQQEAETETAWSEAASAEPINTICPIGGHEPEGEPILVSHNGYTVALCCAGCEMEWAGYTDDERGAIVSQLLASN